MKYVESLVRDLAVEGLVQSSNHRELAQELISYITGVLMQAKIENSVQHVERLEHGVRRMLGLKEAAAA
jgi:TetR/AcrR family transcriptional repressor of nem operon